MKEYRTMDCFDSDAPTDEDLLAFALDDEALPDAKRVHLEQCSICRQRLTSYQKLNDGLVSHLYRSRCPNGMQISLYCEDLLPINERMRIASHLLECPLCAIEAANTRRFMRAVPAIPDAVTIAASPLAGLRRVVGALVRQRAQLVTRAEGSILESAWPRQYHAESLDLSLHLSRASNGASMLLGILTSADDESVDAFEGANAELYPIAHKESTDAHGEEQLSEPLLRTQVDELGNIVFSGVPVGIYSLLVRLPGYELVIEDINIEHR
jgi:hypothetical protein